MTNILLFYYMGNFDIDNVRKLLRRRLYILDAIKV